VSTNRFVLRTYQSECKWLSPKIKKRDTFVENITGIAPNKRNLFRQPCCGYLWLCLEPRGPLCRVGPQDFAHQRTFGVLQGDTKSLHHPSPLPALLLVFPRPRWAGRQPAWKGAPRGNEQIKPLCRTEPRPGRSEAEREGRHRHMGCCNRRASRGWTAAEERGRREGRESRWEISAERNCRRKQAAPVWSCKIIVELCGHRERTWWSSLKQENWWWFTS